MKDIRQEIIEHSIYDRAEKLEIIRRNFVLLRKIRKSNAYPYITPKMIWDVMKKVARAR
ncbi:hypothetical protein KA025_02830 [Candidatus Saccharibacteria bacterium]|nr:hypothetical protein [Candidatus Saccharibacteria bacterium]